MNARSKNRRPQAVDGVTVPQAVDGITSSRGAILDVAACMLAEARGATFGELAAMIHALVAAPPADRRADILDEIEREAFALALRRILDERSARRLANASPDKLRAGLAKLVASCGIESPEIALRSPTTAGRVMTAIEELRHAGAREREIARRVAKRFGLDPQYVRQIRKRYEKAKIEP